MIFDVGGTLIDEHRLFCSWADWLGVPHATFYDTLRTVIEQREPHRRVFDLLKPGFDLAQERRARAAAGRADLVTRDDLYPDALGCLTALVNRGYRVGVAANQPVTTEAVFAELGLPLHPIASSRRWGLEKPAPEFFQRLIHEVGLPPARIAYVGDRVDNDVLPAVNAGLKSVFVRRGPWGMVQANWPEAARAHLVLDDLVQLPRAIATVFQDRT